MRTQRVIQRTTMLMIAALASCTQGNVGRDIRGTAEALAYAIGDKPDRNKPEEMPRVPDGPTTLFVEVLAADTSQPIQGATVRIVERSEKTDELGRVRLDNLVPGETLVQVYAPGYVRVNMNTRLEFVHAASRVYLQKREWSSKPINTQGGIKLGAADGVPDGLELNIRENALVDPLGCQFSGTVFVHVTRFSLGNDLARFTNPPVQLDESSRAPIPIQMAGLMAIEVEKVTGESAIPLTLIQSDDTMMHVTMLVDGIVDETIGLMGFAQDHFSGRWQRGTRNEKFLGSAGPGKKMKWAADVLHLGMLAPGLAFGATKVEKYKVVANGMSSARDRGVLVRALGTRSVSMGFTDQNGEVTLVVPNSGDTVVTLPSLDGTDALALPPDTGNEIQVNVPMSSACSIAGETKPASNSVGVRFCNGFVWGDESLEAAIAPRTDGIGWRCGTDQPGICALGRTTMGGGCEPIIKAMPEMCNGLDDDCDGQVDEEPETMAGIGVDCIADAMTNHLGKTACNAFGAIVCMPNDVPPPDPPECTPGETRFCDYDGPPEKAGIGTCRPGVKKCDAAGKWGPCSESVLPNTQEECDGLDDDCDGTVDEGCACLPEQTEPCYSGPVGTQDVGRCSAGTKTCDTNGQWGTCVGDVLPVTETCNALDDDCDGAVDEGCSCLPGQTAPCYSGPAATADVGICTSGTKTCDMNGQWDVCLGEVLPGTETCNGLDDDCDGAVDQNLFCNNVCLTGCLGGVPNGTCEPQENSFNCAQDCACGDGTCSGSETPENCHVDCKFSSDLNGMCGNHHCDPWEVNYVARTISCPADCWDGVTRPGIICGDGSCAPEESATKCAADCGNAKTYVNGDGVCDPGEHWSTSVDCLPNIDAGTFLKAECQGYALIETYADGNGGTTSHTVTTCSESCGAAPWKMLAATHSGTSFDNVQVLRPDCSTCTISGAPVANLVGDASVLGLGWVDVYNHAEYEMDQDPNKCNLAVYPNNPSSPWYYYYLLPLEWAKIREKDCTSMGGCDVYDCTGNHIPQNDGTVGIWKPAYGSWSMYEAYCH